MPSESPRLQRASRAILILVSRAIRACVVVSGSVRSCQALSIAIAHISRHRGRALPGLSDSMVVPINAPQVNALTARHLVGLGSDLFSSITSPMDAIYGPSDRPSQPSVSSLYLPTPKPTVPLDGNHPPCLGHSKRPSVEHPQSAAPLSERPCSGRIAIMSVTGPRSISPESLVALPRLSAISTARLAYELLTAANAEKSLFPSLFSAVRTAEPAAPAAPTETPELEPPSQRLRCSEREESPRWPAEYPQQCAARGLPA